MTAERPPHITADDPRGTQAAAEILRRHTDGEPEANITSAVRNFLTVTGLVQDDEVVEEAPPAEGSRQAVDLTALDTFIEFKRRIGTTSSGAPNPQYVEQLDDYLAQSAKQGKVRMGILTDGKYWLLRWPGAGEVRLTRPYAFTLEEPDNWITLYEWLRDSALVSLDGIHPDREGIEGHFGPGSPSYQRDIAALKNLYREHAELETIRVKRRLRYDLLRTALGEIAYSTEGMDSPLHHDTEEMDDLFVRHTYLSAVIGMVVQASFGIDIGRLAETDSADLLQGRELYSATGLQCVLESDFFAWPNEVGGEPLLQTLARRVARFDWAEAPADTAATLYESVIPPEERRQLGEYYTPAWLARTMIRELVDDPLNQRVLDPACGSGRFVAEAVSHFIAAARAATWEPGEVLNRLREGVTGIDVHPVAVHLARAAWTLAARPAISDASAAGHDASLSIPVYLGDALQLRFRIGDMFAEHNVTVQVEDEENTELVFPVSLVERAETFDALMGDVSASIERGDEPSLALEDNGIDDPAERQVIGNTIAAMQRLHDKGRNHIWAYYARNMVRPVVLSRSKVDVVAGNPPWINYNQTADILRDELKNLSRNTYGIWAGGHYATQQDVAGLFFSRCVDLYLKDGGVIGFVLPHSALQAGQYSKWRSGQWRSHKAGPSVQVDFTLKPAWDLEQLKPNSFFPIPASVAFARKLSQDTSGKPLGGRVEPAFGISPSEKRTLDLVTDHPMIPREHLALWLGVSKGRVSQMVRSLVDTWGLIERHGQRGGTRYTLSAEGIRYVTHRDRAELPTTRGIWSTELTTDRQGRRRHVGHRIETWARQTKHADGITWFLSKLEAEARDDPDSDLVWSVPTARSDRAYNWGRSAIAPDAVGQMTAGGLRMPFYLEHELRARHPEGVIARLRPYMSYYWSNEPGDDQPPYPVTLFVVDDEDVEDTYVRAAGRMTRMSLPILVSCIPVLDSTGILGRSWRPLWDEDSARLALSDLSAYTYDLLYHRMHPRPVGGVIRR